MKGNFEGRRRRFFACLGRLATERHDDYCAGVYAIAISKSIVEAIESVTKYKPAAAELLCQSGWHVAIAPSDLTSAVPAWRSVRPCSEIREDDGPARPLNYNAVIVTHAQFKSCVSGSSKGVTSSLGHARLGGSGPCEQQC
jgi:hypothetical protein